MTLVDKYRPRTLDDVRGQDWVVRQLGLWLADPSPGAFLFAGGTGTGKTSTAVALAAALGVAVGEGEFGGLYQISSGEQTGETVRQAVRALHHRPFLGSGWRVLVVNEADAMTPNAAHVWLDALESLPRQAVVVFTTNNAAKLPRRLRDRCEAFAFESSALFLRPRLEAFAAEVWAAEAGGACPDIDAFGPLADENGEVSFRRLLQLMEPFVRAARAGVAMSARTADPVPPTADLGRVWERRRGGASWRSLAAELGVPETTLRGRVRRAGFAGRGSDA